jgi:acid phosphatase
MKVSFLAGAVPARLPLVAASVLVLGCVAAPPPVQVPPPASSQATPPSTPRNIENLQALLWVQTAAERRAACIQTYDAARRMLDAALADPTWTAAPEQEGAQRKDLASLPAAVILDVDETVLDNSAFEARRIAGQKGYREEEFEAWVREARAPAVPGAIEFLRAAVEKGVVPFLVTNRGVSVEEATRRNLAVLGYVPDPKVDTLISRGELDPEGGWDKGARRRALAKNYRILMLIGDDFGDFLTGIRVSPVERALLVDRYGPFWGRKWFVLPNPVYGSWAEAIDGFDTTLSPEQELQRKREALDLRELSGGRHGSADGEK